MAEGTIVSNGIDPTKLWSNLSEGKGDLEYLGSVANNLVDFVTTQVKYLKNITPKNIIGGAKALWNNLSKGNWNFFKEWTEEAPAIAKVSAVGAIVVGGFAAGKAALAAGAKIATSSFAKFVITAGVSSGGTVLLTRTQMLERGFNFFETAMETDFNKSTDQFIQETIKNLSEVAKNIAKDLISVSGRTLARVVVDQVGKAYLEVNRRMLGILTLTMTEEVMEDIRSSLGQIASQLWSLGKQIASKGILYLGRDVLADWGIIPQPNDKEEFTVSDYIKKSTKTILSSKDVPEWLQDAFIEGGESGYDIFRDELTNRGGIIDQRRMNIEYT